MLVTADRPVVEQEEPPGHDVGFESPDDGQIEPIGQAKQLPWPKLAWYCPAEQAEQPLEPSSEYVPIEQSVYAEPPRQYDPLGHGVAAD